MAEAEAAYKALDTRYGGRTPLDMFYIRAQRRPGGAAYEEPAKRALQRYFPSGLQRASLQSFSGPPAKGLTILQDKPGVRQIGLAKDDIIVALDGYRTESLFQYQAVRALKDDRSIDLIAGASVAVSTSPPRARSTSDGSDPR